MSRADPPLVSVVLAVHDDARFVRTAVASVLRQTLPDLELIVIDDASTDATPELLRDVSDPRLVVLRNGVQSGLAASLNRGLDRARGRYVARLDADDVALPDRLERQVERLQREPGAAIVGTAVLELDRRDRVGRLHQMPLRSQAVRWLALFTAPLIHPTVLAEREVLERHGFRYDASCLESEDYDLFTRLLEVAGGVNLPEPLVLYRRHAGQASERRRDLQRGIQLRVALAEMSRVAPGLGTERMELAWRLGVHEPLERGRLDAAADAFGELLARFEERYGRDAEVRSSAARTLARRAAAGEAASVALARRALALDPGLPLHSARLRARRRALARRARPAARRWLRALEHGRRDVVPLRVTVVSPEPTPYRAPLFDRIADRPDVELTVVYAGETVAGRTWSVEPRHEAVFLRGVRLPGAQRVLHHDYPLTPAVVRALRESRPDVVVVSGWSTFPCQAAIVWCRARGVPYVLQVESHDLGPRAGWRRVVKGVVVPRLVRNAGSVLVTGTLVRESMVARGAPPDRIGVFAVTIDVEAFSERARRVAASRGELRRALGGEEGDAIVLSAARLVPEKGLELLVRAVACADDPRLLLVLAGEGSERPPLETLARELAVRVRFTGDVAWERMVELYVAADVFALLSEREPWGVVVNEAAACGLPLVLSDRVGAAHDLLRDGDNGYLVPAGDLEAAAHALGRLAEDGELRRAYGARSRELVAEWGYEPSVEAFAAAARRAVGDASPR